LEGFYDWGLKWIELLLVYGLVISVIDKVLFIAILGSCRNLKIWISMQLESLYHLRVYRQIVLIILLIHEQRIGILFCEMAGQI
jgi:hypothetical protein